MKITIDYIEKELRELQKQLGNHRAKMYYTLGAIAAWQRVMELMEQPDQEPHPADSHETDSGEGAN